MSMFNIIRKIRGKLTVFPFIYFLVLSPMLLKAVGIQERFSSPAGLIANFLLLATSYFAYKEQDKFEDFYLIIAINILSVMATLYFFEGAGTAFIFINMLLMINLFNNIEFSREEGILLHFSLSILLLCWILVIDMPNGRGGNMWEPGGVLINPCSFGILSLAFYFHSTILVGLLPIEKKAIKVLLAVGLFALGVYFIYISKCRASLLALFAFAGMQLFRKLLRGHYRKILLAMLAASLLFPLLYIALYYAVGRFEFLGKNFFSGRQIVWESVIDVILKYPILGCGSQAIIRVEGRLFAEPHNLFLGVWKMLGIIPVISLFIVLLSGKNIDKVEGGNVLAKTMFIACLITSTVETLLNGGEYYVFYLSLLATYNLKERAIVGKNGFIHDPLYSTQKREYKRGKNVLPTDIPKKIHYCWFGGKPLNKLGRKCLKSWKKYFPDYEIIEWNESNFDLNACPYVKEAYEAKKWAFVSDYVRFKVLYEQGGIYFDTDVEVIQSFEEILHRGPFFGCENPNLETGVHVAPGLGCAVAPGNPLYLELIQHYEESSFLNEDGSLNLYTVVDRTTDILKAHGLQETMEVQKVEDILIYPAEYFCPIDMNSNELKKTENTYSIHRYAASWVTGKERFRGKIYSFIYRYFGKGAADWFRNVMGGRTSNKK